MALWLSDLPLLPPSEQLQAEEEAAFVLENVFFPNLNECDVHELATYVNIWLEGSLHDLSREARQKRALYIELLEVASSACALYLMNLPQKVKFSVFSFGGLVELSYLCTQYNPKNEE